MLPVSAPAVSGPTYSAGPHSPVVVNVESSPGDAVKVSIDDHVGRKKVAVRFFYPQTYRCEEVWLTTFRVDKVQNRIRAVSQKPEDDSVESPRVKRYQYGAQLMVVANHLSGNFGAANVDSMLNNRAGKVLSREQLFGSSF